MSGKHRKLTQVLRRNKATLRARKRHVSPAMAAGVTKRLWEMGDIVNVLEAWEQSSRNIVRTGHESKDF
jgi:hypothetical protein